MWKKAELSDNAKMLINVGYPKISSIVMGNAGISTKEEAERFLHSEEVYDPAEIRNIEAVSDIIWSHIYKGSRICIFADYDADGITGGAILYLALKRLGADVVVRVPDRIYEGYGISKKAVLEQIELGAKLFITIDNGIRAIEEIELIREMGCQSVILDHHQPGETLPNPDAMIDLWIEGETYPFRELTGSGLAWKVVCYMLTQVDDYDYGMSLVDLAAIGTIADVAPLIGENRAIVKRAINRMRDPWYDREGVRAIYGKSLDRITTEDIAFQIAPCINAPGRLYEQGAKLPLLLLLENNDKTARMLATKVSDANAERKKLQQQWCEQLEGEAERRVEAGEKVLVMLADGAPSGIVGLIAGNLKEKYNRPAIIFAPKQDISGETVWCGSGRSVRGLHLLNGLNACADLFIHYGGHELAAGMTIPSDKEILSELRKRLNEEASYLSEEDLTPVVYWDTEITERELTSELYEELQSLEPFGAGVAKPVFKMELHASGREKNHDLMGADKSHLKLYCDSYSAVGFSLAAKYIRTELPDTVVGLGYPSENYFNGKVYRQFTLLDFEPLTLQCKLVPQGKEYGEDEVM